VQRYAAGAVPGLLHADPYALAVATHTAGPPKRTALEGRLLRERVDRDTELAYQVLAEHPGQITVVEDGALRRPTGGTEALADQVVRLRILATGHNPVISLRILPSDADVYAGAGTAFTVLHFASGLPPVALGEHLGRQMLLEGPAAAPYLAAVDSPRPRTRRA
jgi:hypothetical protein